MGSDAAGLNRRQLLRAGVWAAPALVLATAAPAAAASTPPVVTPPPSAIAVPGGGTGALPTYLIGATGVTAKPYWKHGTPFMDPANPHRAGFELNVSGIPHIATARTVTMYFYVPTSTAPLNRANPATWMWTMDGSNFSSMTAVFEPGVWRLTFVMPSWGRTSYAHVYVTFPS